MRGGVQESKCGLYEHEFVGDVLGKCNWIFGLILLGHNFASVRIGLLW